MLWCIIEPGFLGGGFPQPFQFLPVRGRGARAREYIRAGVVDPDIDPPEFREHGADQGVQRRFVGDIGWSGHGPTAGLPEPPHHLPGLIGGLEVIHNHPRALFGKGRRDARADAAAGAGNHGDPVFKALHESINRLLPLCYPGALS